MKDSYEWGLIPGHRVGLLHRWTVGIGGTFLRTLVWVSSCGLHYSNEHNHPEPSFTTEGIKCEKCRKEQKRVNKILNINKIKKTINGND